MSKRSLFDALMGSKLSGNTTRQVKKQVKVEDLMKRSAFDLMVSKSSGVPTKQHKEEAVSLKTCCVCGESFRYSNAVLNMHIDQCLNKKEKEEVEKGKSEIENALLPVRPLNIKKGPVEGLYLITDFLTKEEEERLVHDLDTDNEQWKYSAFNGHCDSMSFGVKTVHGLGGGGAAGHVRKNNGINERDIPRYMKTIIDRIHDIHHHFTASNLNLNPFDSGGSGGKSIVDILKSFKINEFNANSYEKRKGHFLRQVCV